MFYYLSICLAFIIIWIVLLYIHLTRNFSHWKNKNVPYVQPLPFFGNIFKVLTFQRSIGHFVHDLYKTTNLPFIGFFIFDKPFLLIREPEMIKKCLIKDFEYFEDRSIAENRKDDEMASNSLLILKNPTWRSHRVTVSPVYAIRRIKGMLPLLLDASNDLVNYVNNTAIKEEATETREVAMKFTTDVIASCLFGIKAQCFHNEKAAFRDASRRIFEWGLGRKISMASYFIAPILVKLFKLKFYEPNAARFFEEIVKTTVADKEKSKLYRGDILDVLIHIRNEKRPGSDLLDDKVLAAQSAQSFIAGFETTGSTISFALYQLSLDPSIQNRLRKEIQNVLQNREDITHEAIQEIVYLDMTIKETLRLYPPLSFLERRCTKSYKISGTDAVIDKGVPIYISLFGLHLDPKYFPNPENFDPEHFANKNTRPSCCYMPFGEGPRNCLGAQLGLLIVKVALIRILTEFEVEVCKTTQIPLEMDQKVFMLTPIDGINLHFKKVSK